MTTPTNGHRTCERCGQSPAFAVVWSDESGEHTEYLCAACDRAEQE